MPLSIPIVWSDAHSLHEPGGEVWVGVRTPGTEVPARAERIREVLEAAGAPIVAAEPAPDDVATPPADAITTESGLKSRVLTAGTGTAKPAPTDLVTVQYTGWSAEGRMFDSTYSRGKPSTFPLDRVIPGWREGVQLMVAGEKRRFWIPEALAYAAEASLKSRTPVSPAMF